VVACGGFAVVVFGMKVLSFNTMKINKNSINVNLLVTPLSHKIKIKSFKFAFFFICRVNATMTTFTSGHRG
jgi:hypothetical protein